MLYTPGDKNPGESLWLHTKNSKTKLIDNISLKQTLKYTRFKKLNGLKQDFKINPDVKIG